MPGQAHIQVEGYREFVRDLRRTTGELPKALGIAHKNVGKFIIERLDPPPEPAAVGAGSGATVRPSATKREVLLRVGYAGRESALSQWGKKPVQPFVSGRPHILGTIQANEDAIRQELLDQLMKILAPAFSSAE